MSQVLIHEYPGIDARIKQTYIVQSATQKTKLYDMYARFFRWASDRLSADGVLAFVTNRSFIDSRTFDGFRKTVATEFVEAYVVDLGGERRTLAGGAHRHARRQSPRGAAGAQVHPEEPARRRPHRHRR